MSYEASEGLEEKVIDIQSLHGDYIADITFAKTDSGESKIIH